MLRSQSEKVLIGQKTGHCDASWWGPLRLCRPLSLALFTLPLTSVCPLCFTGLAAVLGHIGLAAA